jgi:hypothetical protein
MAVVWACEAAGIDMMPDDTGLERRAEEMINARQALLGVVVPTLPAAPGGAVAGAAAAPETQLEAERIAERMRAKQELAERAEMETALEALRRHIRERRHFFHRAIWSTYDHSWIAERLRQLGLPPALFDLRFHAFEGESGAVRLVNEKLAAKLGFDFASLARWKKVAEVVAQQPKVISITAPAPGLVVEPYLGDCVGADVFVSEHRKIDLDRAAADLDKAKADADYAKAEADRVKRRVAAGNLSDPRPFMNVTTVELDGLELVVAVPQPAATTPTDGDDG